MAVEEELAVKMCLNRNVLIGLGAVALGVWVFVPDAFSAARPLLVLLACPLSMVFMMRAMSSGSGASCSAGSDSSGAETSDTAPVDETPDEVVRLRAEVDQLRAELGPSRQTGSPGETVSPST